MIMEDNKLIITTKPKIFHFGLLKDVAINLKHFVIKHNEILLSKYKHGNSIHHHNHTMNE